MPTDQVSKQS